MKTLITVLACLTLLATLAVAQDHNYIPLEPGNELWYVNTGDPSLTSHTFFEAGPGGTSIFNSEALVNGSVVGSQRGHFTGTPEGDVIWIGPEIGGDLIPFSSQYLRIDAPLFAGKTWSFETSHPMLRSSPRRCSTFLASATYIVIRSTTTSSGRTWGRRHRIAGMLMDSAW